MGDRVSDADYGHVPKSKARAWKKWKKLIKLALLDEAEQDLIAVNESSDPVTSLPDPVELEPEIIINPPPPIFVPDPETSIRPEPTPEPKPQIIINPAPPIFVPDPEASIRPEPTPEPKPQIIINPAPPIFVPDPEISIRPEPTAEPKPQIIINPAPPIFVPDPETSIRPEPTPEPKPQIIINPVPPMLVLDPETSIRPEPLPEPEIIINPAPPMPEPNSDITSIYMPSNKIIDFIEPIAFPEVDYKPSIEGEYLDPIYELISKHEIIHLAPPLISEADFLSESVTIDPDTITTIPGLERIRDDGIIEITPRNGLNPVNPEPRVIQDLESLDGFLAVDDALDGLLPEVSLQPLEVFKSGAREQVDYIGLVFDTVEELVTEQISTE